jgi:hypothetical protein
VEAKEKRKVYEILIGNPYRGEILIGKPRRS